MTSEASNELSSVVGAFDELPQLKTLNLAGNRLCSFKEAGTGRYRPQLHLLEQLRNRAVFKRHLLWLSHGAFPWQILL